MKHIFISLSIATFSFMGVSAQEDFKRLDSEENQKNLRIYQEQQEEKLDAIIREQINYYIWDANRRLEAQRIEVQNEREALAAWLKERPAGTVERSNELNK